MPDVAAGAIEEDDVDVAFEGSVEEGVLMPMRPVQTTCRTRSFEVCFSVAVEIVVGLAAGHGAVLVGVRVSEAGESGVIS